MGNVSGLSIHQQGTAFFVDCSYDLDGLDAPSLGPYPSRELASRAEDEIFATITGNCE